MARNTGTCKATHIFAWSGLILGATIIGLSVFLITHPAVRRLKANENHSSSMNVLLSYHEIYDVFLVILITGVAKVALNITGLRTDKMFQIFYRIAIILLFIITMIWVYIVYSNLEHYKKMLLDNEHISIDLWQIVNVMFPERIVELQTNYECCGWYNVFDHCSPYLKTQLIYNVIENDALDSYIDRATRLEESNQYYAQFDSSSSNSSNSYEYDYESIPTAQMGPRLAENPDYEYPTTATAQYKNNSICNAFVNFEGEPFFYDESCYIDEQKRMVLVRNVCKEYACPLDGCREAFTDLLMTTYQTWWLPVLIIAAAFVLFITGTIIAVGVELCLDLRTKRIRRRTLRLKQAEIVPLNPTT